MALRTLHWWTMAVVAVIALAAGIYVARELLSRDPGSIDATALMGLTLPDSDGREQALAQWRGKVIVVNFWATWCAPCREEMPEFVKAQNEWGGKGLQFVGVAIDEADKVKPFIREIGLNYPSLIGGYGAMELSKALGNQLMALPFTIVIDRQGAVAHKQLGPLKPEQLRRIVVKLL